MTKFHWKMFLNLEKDIETISQYIELNENNYSTYSVEIFKLFLVSCSEVEDLFKLVCKRIDEKANRGEISDWKSLILTKYPNIINTEVSFYGDKELKIKPFEEWDSKKLAWWTIYGQAKHNKSEFYSEVTLENLLYSLTALLVLLIKYYEDEPKVSLLTNVFDTEGLRQLITVRK